MAGINFFNSKECEWADIVVQIGGANCGKLMAIKYGIKAAKEHLFAAGDEPISIQSGNREPTGSITLLKGAFDNVNAAAVAATGRDLTDLQFDIIVTYKAKGTRALQTDSLIGCEISDFNLAWGQGDKSAKLELPFLFLNLIRG